MNEDLELYMQIEDDFNRMELFSTEDDYPDADDDFLNEVRISIKSETEVVGYMECILFYDQKIFDGSQNHVFLADELSQDVYDAMHTLEENGYLKPFNENAPLDDLSSIFGGETVYLRYVAVREDYRRKGIGAWLLRNLPNILCRNYSVLLKTIITSILPQSISWDNLEPSFRNPDKESPADKEMFKAMVKLFEVNGYRQLGNTNYYVLRPNE